tara:strand:+ start:305 stop:559 length:255 start_codon:yes stop_codon:yes gene_type:complete
MKYKLLGEMITGAITNNIVPQTDGTGSTLVHIVVATAQDVIQVRGGLIVGRIHMVANSSIDLVKESTDTIDCGDAFATPIAYQA